MHKNEKKVDTQKIDTTGNVVFVYANLPDGQTFLLNGKTVSIKGYGVDRLRLPGGECYNSSQYEVTVVEKGVWEEVIRVYGEMMIFKSGLVFSAPSREIGDSQARERSGLKHGLEPLDPEKELKTKSL